MAKDQGKEMVKENENSSPEGEEQDKCEEAKSLIWMSLIHHQCLSLKGLLRLNLNPNLGSSWGNSGNYKSISYFWLSFSRHPCMQSFLMDCSPIRGSFKINAMVSLMEKYSAILQNKLPSKL